MNYFICEGFKEGNLGKFIRLMYGFSENWRKWGKRASFYGNFFLGKIENQGKISNNFSRKSAYIFTKRSLQKLKKISQQIKSKIF
jgi:hypothetical protein